MESFRVRTSKFHLVQCPTQSYHSEHYLPITFFRMKILVFLCILTLALSQELSESKLNRPCTVTNQTRACGDELVCFDTTRNITSSAGTCQYCRVDTDCWSKSLSLQCKTSINTRNGVVMTCQHKDLFPRITWYDFGATLTNFLGATISTAGGIGGGGIYVPLLYGVGQFPLSMCIPLSKAMVLGGSVANILLLSQERHPSANRPLIYYEVATIFEPVVLLGTTVGVICNMMFPNWLIVILLLVVISLMTVRVTIKGVQLCIQENKDRLEASSHIDTPKGDYKVVNSDGTEISESQIEPLLTENQPDPDHHQELKDLHHGEASTPWFQLLLLSFCWLFLFIIALFKGGHGVQSVVGVLPCSPWFWVLFAIPFPIIIVLSVLFGMYLFYQSAKKKKLGYKFAKGDIQWNLCNLLVYPTFFCLAGFFASLLGIGSGMLKAPLLVELGLEPVVAAATSTYMILFTASITVAQYTFLGRMPFDYGMWFAGTGFLAALIGQLVIGYIVKRYKMQSLIVFLLVAVMIISVFLMGGLGIAKVVTGFQNAEYMGFKTPC